MTDIIRIPDETYITTEEGIQGDAALRFELKDRQLNVYLKAADVRVRYVTLRWSCAVERDTLILADRWERSYGDLEWKYPDCERYMPWYFIAHRNGVTTGTGVRVRPSGMVCFSCDPHSVTAWFDVRNGGTGVELNSRELLMGTLVCESYEGISAFEAMKRFCRVMCSDPVLPEKPVYGSNNWYYAYGNSSREEILADARLLSSLTEGLENRPYMVIDDGWTVNRCCGPWLPNEKFGDMKTLADEFKQMDVRPGIWIRPLNNEDIAQAHPDWCIQARHDGELYLDPTVPQVRDYLRSDLRRIKEWGYELVKHDFTTYDIFGAFGGGFKGSITYYNNWSFHDKTKTSAEIVKELYALIKEETAGQTVIGCNTVSHLSAGMFALQRTGDDTSGREWGPTRRMGVNTLAFRLAQNKAFYMVDADCVGILGNNIPWKLNRQWLDLLSKSGSPLFVSCQPSAVNEERIRDLKKAFEISSVQSDIAEPLDWFYSKHPEIWSINGEKTVYDWHSGYIRKEP
ncbi:MAG: alpha-galactosidase [Clostridia bacterium]|nr:alpha-galactosidase [Clostridia bacterium]